MITIAEASRRSGIPRPTIQLWARTGQIKAEKRDSVLGPIWHTTIESVLARWEWRGKGGRPRKK